MARTFHLALAVEDVAAVVDDYTERLGTPPTQVVPGVYALWRTPEVNLSISRAEPGTSSLRHVGFEDDSVSEKTYATDVTGLLWERFNHHLQDAEIQSVYGSPEQR
jgi:hypothetical protein